MSFGPDFLSGYCAIVTGGAQGIGSLIVRGLVAVGCRVAIVDLQGEKAEALAKELGLNALAIEADITKEAERLAVVERVNTAFGGVDILINNAAPGRNRSLLGKISDADWPGHQALILAGAALMSERLLDHLSRSGRGSIVNISSMLSDRVAVDQASVAYHVSKAGLDQFTRWLAVRCGRLGVRVNGVSPALVDRDVGQKLSDNPVNRKIIETIVPLGRAATGSDIANSVIFLVSGAASYITGQVLVVDGGLGLQETFGASRNVYEAFQQDA